MTLEYAVGQQVESEDAHTLGDSTSGSWLSPAMLDAMELTSCSGDVSSILAMSAKKTDANRQRPQVNAGRGNTRRRLWLITERQVSCPGKGNQRQVESGERTSGCGKILGATGLERRPLPGTPPWGGGAPGDTPKLALPPPPAVAAAAPTEQPQASSCLPRPLPAPIGCPPGAPRKVSPGCPRHQRELLPRDRLVAWTRLTLSWMSLASGSEPPT